MRTCIFANFAEDCLFKYQCLKVVKRVKHVSCTCTPPRVQKSPEKKLFGRIRVCMYVATRFCSVSISYFNGGKTAVLDLADCTCRSNDIPPLCFLSPHSCRRLLCKDLLQIYVKTCSMASPASGAVYVIPINELMSDVEKASLSVIHICEIVMSRPEQFGSKVPDKRVRVSEFKLR